MQLVEVSVLTSMWHASFGLFACLDFGPCCLFLFLTLSWVLSFLEVWQGFLLDFCLERLKCFEKVPAKVHHEAKVERVLGESYIHPASQERIFKPFDHIARNSMCQKRDVKQCFFLGQISLFLQPEKYDFNTYKGFLGNYW
jgi:hypothetical protein